MTWTSGHNGTLSSTGATVTAIRHTIFGTVECRYATSETHIGTVTGGNPATLHIEGVIPFHSGGGLCGEGASQWSGDYQTTGALYIASSTTLTAPTGTASGSVAFKAQSEGHVNFENVVAVFECNWTFEGTIEASTVALTNVSINVCTGGSVVTVPSLGQLEIEWTSGYSGKVFWTGGTIEWKKNLIQCRYKTNKTVLGTITGGNPATMHVVATLPNEGGVCIGKNEPTVATGSFNVTSPSSLYVDKVS